MKVMYIAPRFHTNQLGIIKGWVDNGHEVKFISYYSSIIEDYEYVKPIILGFSPVYYLIDKLYCVLHHNAPTARLFKINYGFPPFFKLKKIIKDWKPDVIILRERSLYSIAAYMIAKKNSKCILYNQTPMWDEPLKTDIRHRLVYALTPKCRFTPVMGNEEPGKAIAPYSYFLPFVVEPIMSPDEKTYFKDDKFNFLCVGVYNDQKNHKLTMRALDLIRDKLDDSFQLTIVGEVTADDQIQYFEELKECIDKLGLNRWVTLYTNQPKSDMGAFYKDADVFLLPSRHEPASVSQLEAMAYSIPVICSNTNGTGCHVIDGYNGFHSIDDDAESLAEKLLYMIEHKEDIPTMGANAYKSVKENNSFEKYYEGICQIIGDMA